MAIYNLGLLDLVRPAPAAPAQAPAALPSNLFANLTKAMAATPSPPPAAAAPSVLGGLPVGPIVLGGAGLVALYLFTRRKRHT